MLEASAHARNRAEQQNRGRGDWRQPPHSRAVPDSSRKILGGKHLARKREIGETRVVPCRRSAGARVLKHDHSVAPVVRIAGGAVYRVMSHESSENNGIDLPGAQNLTQRSARERAYCGEPEMIARWRSLRIRAVDLTSIRSAALSYANPRVTCAATQTQRPFCFAQMSV